MLNSICIISKTIGKMYSWKTVLFILFIYILSLFYNSNECSTVVKHWQLRVEPYRRWRLNALSTKQNRWKMQISSEKNSKNLYVAYCPAYSLAQVFIMLRILQIIKRHYKNELKQLEQLKIWTLINIHKNFSRFKV